MLEIRRTVRRGFGLRSVAALAFLIIIGWATPSLGINKNCIVVDDGTGTAELPPPQCTYSSSTEVFEIFDGLPPETTIELRPYFHAFVCTEPGGVCGTPGGILGGEVEDYLGTMVFEVVGTGDLDGFRRVITFTLGAQTHSGPRIPGDPVQTFPTEFFSLAGSLAPGDPDFLSLEILGGPAFGSPSPGMTTLTQLGDGTFNVDSFFDLGYSISYIGTPGGALGTASGSNFGNIQLRAEKLPEHELCVEPNDGTGTVSLPPLGCSSLTPRDPLKIVDGLPKGTALELEALLYEVVCTGRGAVCGTPGGNLGGEREEFDATLRLYVKGTGFKGGFRRILRIPVSVITDSGPRTPGDPIQSFPTDMFSLLGGLPPGDPDFAVLSITAGSANALPSPGHTTLQNLGDGTFQVDSFFDITYEIGFVGMPGGALDGMSGTTTASARMETRHGKVNAVAEDNGNATATLPPELGEYVNPDDWWQMIEGLPPGITIDINSSLSSFFCSSINCSSPGGDLGGEVELFDATLDLALEGTGDLVGFSRTLEIPVTVEIHSAPRTGSPFQGFGGIPTQSFDRDFYQMLGALPPGDPDFQTLTIAAGSNAAKGSSPGRTTLTDQGDGTFLVDSFFDINYQIDFVGAPGGPLDGLIGTTEEEVRLEAGNRSGAQAHNIRIVLDTESEANFTFGGDLGGFTLNDDASPMFNNWKLTNNLLPGSYSVSQTLELGWILSSIICDDPDAGTTVDTGAGKATIDLDLGEAITCTFTNDLDPTYIFSDGFESGDTSAWSNTLP